MPDMRALLGIGTAFILGGLSLCSGISLALSAAKPELALNFQPWNARAKAFQALHLVERDRSAAVALQAEEIAGEALRRDPTMVQAVAAAGIAAELRRDNVRAARLFGYSNRISRRDLVTQLWLIEAAVRRDDVSGALAHFDAAISGTRTGNQVLFPVLASALNDAQLVEPISDLVAKDRWWKDHFLGAALERTENSSNLARLFANLQRRGAPARNDMTARLLIRLADEGRFDDARTLNRIVDPTMERRWGRALVRDGEMGDDKGYPPFAWQFVAGDNMLVQRSRPPDRPSNQALHIVASNGVKSPVIRQLTFLSPGTYQLTSSLRTDTADGNWDMSWVVTCGAAKRLTAQVDLPARGESWRLHQGRINIPRDCPAQWLSLVIQGDDLARELNVWLDDVTLKPIGPAVASGELSYGGGPRHTAAKVSLRGRP